VRVVVIRTHGVNIGKASGPLNGFFGDAPEMYVEEHDPNVSGALLRHLKAGRSVYIAMDKLEVGGKGPTIELLGHRINRVDGPAWLAVTSGLPIALWSTYDSAKGVAITASPLLHPDPSLPVKLRVADLSERLYACAEAAIREHPEAWTGWAFPSPIGGYL
jgi:lauroyl/myristoyl acyltransferase